MALAKVEIAFGVDPFDDTSLDVGGNWVDVTSSVRNATYNTSSRSDQFVAFAAGQATVVLDNRTRNFDPSYASSPYVNDFKRNTPIRITGVHSSTDYVQWYGYVQSWLPSYATINEATTTVSAIDGLGVLARYSIDELAAASHDGDTAGARIGRVLDEVGFPSAYRDLDGGELLTSTTFGVNALQHCQLAALSDGGFFYAQRDGTLSFDGVESLTTSRQLTSQVTLSHSTAPKYLIGSLHRSGVGQGFRNLVRIGGAAVTTGVQDNSTTNEAPDVYQRLDLLIYRPFRLTLIP